MDRYARRGAHLTGTRYSMLNPSVYLAVQERERALLRVFARFGRPLDGMTVLEIGCGAGGNLAEMIKLGFLPENLSGIDLLDERIAAARHRLPTGVSLLRGDALTATLPAMTYDIVYVSTVFSSILNADFQMQLARRMWEFVKPGGLILWYDFTYNNPRNPDVRGVTVSRIRELFPASSLHRQKVTLAPPVSRRVTRLHPMLYTVFNVLPFLRTHVLCAIMKSRD